MASVVSNGMLADLTNAPGWQVSTLAYGAGSVLLYDRYRYDYATLYRLQPNVRTCVDFLARNIAQLGLHVFRRVGETDRIRLREHGLARLLARPLPPEYKTTSYRLIEALVADLGVYFNAFWLKIGSPPVGLLRLPPMYVEVEGGLAPTRYRLRLGAQVWEFAPGQVVHFRGYNPENPIYGLSPLETLRRTLAEEQAAGEYREYYWLNSARMSGIIKRPAEAPEWSDAARERFKLEFEALYAGAVNSGRTAILEDGMEWQEMSFSAQESEYLAGRKLTREECARAYHIPLPMVGILDHATFSNIREQHKQLYQDCLGPWCAMIEDEIELQLLPDFAESSGVYVEFNIAEKLQGAFDEQVQALQAAVGRPWMTANEARARLNLPQMAGDADALVTPLNVLVGGQASPQDVRPGKAQAAGLQPERKGRKAQAVDGERIGRLREQHVAKWTEVLEQYFRRQYAALSPRLRPGAGIETVWHDGERWDRELGEDLTQLSMATATVFGRLLAEEFEGEFEPERMEHYVTGYAARKAAGINRASLGLVEQALLAVNAAVALRELFDRFAETRAREVAQAGVTAMSSFGMQEGAKQAGVRTKTWRHGGAKEPRPEHLALDGETVEIGDLFSNGARWPGDPVLGPDETVYCHCWVEFGRER